ncbi:MAG: hypothetical protein H6Q61_597 [Firmicutes bacterium]|nr:hypothetical protein [Bacillota bacterium]
MTRSRPWRRIAILLVMALLFTLPASAFVIGTAEDLEALTGEPENSDPVQAHNSVPIAQNFEFFTYKNVAIEEHLSAFDPDGDRITFRLTKNPARGAAELSETGLLTYSPYENKTGKDSFTYVAEDAFGNVSSPATVKIKIQKQKSKVVYADMSGHPAHRDAVRLAEEGVLVGQCLGGTYFFQPDGIMSREAFLALSMAALGEDALPDATVTGFSDDDTIAVWAKPYVASALRAGAITGAMGDTGRAVFDPLRPITKGEATVLVNRLLNLTDVPAAETLTEEASAPVWAAQSVRNLEAVGVLQEALSPDDLSQPLTNSDSAQMISAALDVLDFRANSGKFHFF